MEVEVPVGALAECEPVLFLASFSVAVSIAARKLISSLPVASFTSNKNEPTRLGSGCAVGTN